MVHIVKGIGIKNQISESQIALDQFIIIGDGADYIVNIGVSFVRSFIEKIQTCPVTITYLGDGVKGREGVR